MKTAEELINWYSAMTRVEQAKFDKRYRDFKKFQRTLKLLTNELKQTLKGNDGKSGTS